MNRVVVATLVGAVTAFILGFLIYGVALASFFAANVGSAMGVVKDPPAIAAIALSGIPFSILLALVISKWGNSTSAVGGAKVGAIIGFLTALGFDLTLYGTTNVQNLTATLADPIVFSVYAALTGAVIGMVLGRGKPATA